MSVTSSFTPLNELLLDDEDLDMGSGGNLLLPDQPGPNPHLMVGVGKYGNVYLVNRDSMGGFNATNDQMVQELTGAVGGMFSTPAYWQGMVPNVGLQNMIYTVASDDVPKMLCDLQRADPDTAGIVSGAELPFRIPGSHRRLSRPMARPAASCGRSTVRHGSQVVTAILYAFDATNLNNELYDSNQFSRGQSRTRGEVRRPDGRQWFGLCGNADPAGGVRIVAKSQTDTYCHYYRD